METLNDYDLMRRVRNLVDSEDFDDECELCHKPRLVHAGLCVRSETVDADCLVEIWKEFRVRMKSLMKSVREEKMRKVKEVEISTDLKALIGHMNEKNMDNIEKLCGIIVKSRDENAKPSKVIKTAKVPIWSKEMSLETFSKQISTWNEVNLDVPEYSRYQDLIESLKMNKEIKGLSAYINDHVIKVCEKREDQEVSKVLDVLSKKYGRSRVEKMEVWIENWFDFKDGDFDDEDDFLFAMKEIGVRKKELKVTDEEMLTMWMLWTVKKRKKMETYEYHILRDVVKKEEGEAMSMRFEEKYKELKVEGKREKVVETHYMGSESLSRQRYQRSQSRDRGRSWNRQDQNRGRSRSFGSRNFDQGGGRRFSQSRSFGQGDNGGRQESKTRGFDQGRLNSRNRFENCIGCKCKACIEMRKAAHTKVVNMSEVEKKCQHDCCKDKEINVKLCETDEILMNEDILVHYTDMGKQVMIVDSGAPLSLTGKEWLGQYLNEFNLKVEELKNNSCKQAFRFGTGKRYVSTEMVEIPVVVEKMDGKEDVLRIPTYLVDIEVPFICGKKTLESWDSKLDMKRKVLETTIDGARSDFKMIDIAGNHYGIVLETKNGDESNILLVDKGGEEEKLISYKEIKKVHEVNNHKKKEQMINAYSNAGLMSPKTVNTINRVVNDCKICQKFQKSVVRPKVSLPK